MAKVLFPNTGNLCHVQIHYMGRKHDNNGVSKYITQLRSWVKTIFVQNKKICQFVKFLADQTPYASNEVYGNRMSGPFLQVPLFTSHIHKDSMRGFVHKLISFSLNTYLSLFVRLTVGFQLWKLTMRRKASCHFFTKYMKKLSKNENHFQYSAHNVSIKSV